MSTTPPLPSEVEQALKRYLEIQREERRLADEKNELRRVLWTHLDGIRWDRLFWHPTVAGQSLRVRYQKRTVVEYDEEELRRRLGDRYAHILRADPRKIRQHLAEVEEHLKPVLELIGSPNRDRVRSAILARLVAKEDFAGAFRKTIKRTIAVLRERPDLPDVPPERPDLPDIPP